MKRVTSPLELEVGWGPAAFLHPDSVEDARPVAVIVQLVALFTNIAPREIAAPTRNCAKAARARHIAMYLAYTVYAWPLARVAAAFGRDRSTASHACRRVEDLREDAWWEARLAHMEGCVRAILTEWVR